MNKNAIKNYAIWARNELITRVTQKAFEYGVSKDDIIDSNADSINGRLLTAEEKQQRQKLISEVQEKGFDQVMEEVAYTWFNRFIALRYMEVNNYLPNRVRVFTNGNNEFKPQLLDEAATIELDGLDKEKIYELLDLNKNEELYKLLLLATCNDMHNYLPELFETIKDYKVLLFPENLLRSESVLGRLIFDIDEDSWKDQVQIIGWMYQYYVSEKHDQIIKINKGTVKKEDIPAATQLFTTDWVVRYMVDNSLGRYWVERNPNSSLKEKLKFLATSKNDDLPVINETITPEKLTFIDDCMGSGHILVYAFDVLMDIYRECGYSDRDAAESIIKNNLFGLDIDSRAYQLAYFAVMMKGRFYNRRILSKPISNNLAEIVETNYLDAWKFEGMVSNEEVDEIGEYLVSIFADARELGSLITVESRNYDMFEQWLNSVYNDSEITLEFLNWSENIYPALIKICKQAKILSNKYVAVTTNPPYLSKLDGKLKRFVIENYKDYSSDLFSVFMRRNIDLTITEGYLGFMTPFVWMFIKSYEKMRKYIIQNKAIATLVQMEYSAYEEATVPICSFVLENSNKNKIGYYFRLSNFKGGMDIQKNKILEAIYDKECGYFYETDCRNFNNIPGNPIGYWASSKLISAFQDGRPLSPVCKPVQGLATGDNGRFLRLWFEVCNLNITYDASSREDSIARATRWFPCTKGGEFRKWYGNRNYVVNWENDGYEIRNFVDSKGKLRSRPQNMPYYFKESITWSTISSSSFSMRYLPQGSIFETKGSVCVVNSNDDIKYYLGLMNSSVVSNILEILCPTLDYHEGPIGKVPTYYSKQFKPRIDQLVEENIEISKKDWDSFETSWDYNAHPLVKYKYNTIKKSYLSWSIECNNRFDVLKANEEELNVIFNKIYGIESESDSNLKDKDITVRKADLTRDIKSFISYAVGCMFGRYSLDVEGLAYAGGEWDNNKYKSYIPDEDNIIPICDDEYFEDDIIGRFIEFIKVVYGEESIEENLEFISKALGGKGTPREVLRNYFLNDFFKDHCNTYQVTGSGKRPIYWLFDSGKKNGFKALMYIHRYTPDLIARMRTQYIHEQQARYRNQIEMLEKQVASDISTSERVRLNRQLKKFKEQDEELRKYEEKIHHWADRMEPMDLDDGVKANYAKFQELLAKIK